MNIRCGKNPRHNVSASVERFANDRWGWVWRSGWCCPCQHTPPKNLPAVSRMLAYIAYTIF
jgi:hypothetical protein